ncbi:hypothetical protein HanRHA438_Chr11g0481141 [Helianthus annuus]|nr:hypothetical protein HanRHA438_Chr11g0481141 [Helianthus annuus]
MIWYSKFGTDTIPVRLQDLIRFAHQYIQVNFTCYNSFITEKDKKESKISCCVYKTSFKTKYTLLTVCMKSNLNGAITCIIALLQDLMSSLPTGTNTVTEIPKSGYRYRIYLVWYSSVPVGTGTAPVFEGKNQ